ncbi:hypothetical protein V494_00292 [Pseudogymnoascus sp. VKM F-4513 (FW-928)]|nr:hypothetical protein V494_00292 [Pseudogymnoascus sp. VKM F-4513 (FW-928)]
MDKLSDLQRIPVEVFDRVLELLHADSELVSLSQVCRDMNERVTPLIYSHVVIDLSPHLNLVRAEDIEEDDADMDVTMSFNLMAGLANNYRRQCRHVRKLTVRNGYSKASTKGTRWGVPGKGTYFDVSSLSIHSPWVWANMILGMTIPRMPLLSDLVWTAEMPLTNQIFGCLPPGQLKSLVYRFGRDFEFHLTIEWPSKFTPGLRAMKNPSLSSLTIMDIPSHTTDNGFSFLVDNRESLKDLTLKFTEDFSFEDKLLSVVNPIIELQSKLRLESLHLRNTSCRGHLGWLEAFDFTCIRKFVMFESAPLGLTMPTELWNIFRRTGQRFESLITDCENDEFIEFVESTQGLEQLMLCHSSRSIYNFPKLNNHFDTLKSLFLPQNYPFERQLPYHEEHIFGILSGLQNLKHLFFDRHDDLACGDAVEPTPGSALFIKSFCDFCNEKNAALAVLSRLELIGYFRTLWTMNSSDQIDTERDSNQLEEIDRPEQRPNDSRPLVTKIADKHNCVPVQIGWDDRLDDEMNPNQGTADCPSTALQYRSAGAAASIQQRVTGNPASAVQYSDTATAATDRPTLEEKSKTQAREIRTHSSLISSLLSELYAVRSKQEGSSLPVPARPETAQNMSSLHSLPDAIRQRIWRYTFPEPQIVQLFGTERVVGLASKIPLAMHICHDSRQVARSVYRQMNMKNISGGLDSELDILYISTAVKYYSPVGLLSDLAHWFELKDIRHIAFQYELWKIMCDDKEALGRFLGKLERLQELIIVIDDEVPATPARRKRHVEFVHCGNSVREVIVGMVSRTLVDFGKDSLLSKIRYRKAVRHPAPAYPSKTALGIDS